MSCRNVEFGQRKRSQKNLVMPSAWYHVDHQRTAGCRAEYRQVVRTPTGVTYRLSRSLPAFAFAGARNFGLGAAPIAVARLGDQARDSRLSAGVTCGTAS